MKIAFADYFNAAALDILKVEIKLLLTLFSLWCNQRFVGMFVFGIGIDEKALEFDKKLVKLFVLLIMLF